MTPPSTPAMVRRRGGRLAVVTAVAGTVLIALGAFWLSFTALADLERHPGIEASQAWAWPLIVDGILVVATVSVVALAGQRGAWYPWVLLAAGAIVSVTANALHAVVAADADVPGVLAASVAAVPPLVLLAITHLTVILTRPLPEISPAAATHDDLTPVEHPTEPPGPDDAAEPRPLLPTPRTDNRPADPSPRTEPARSAAGTTTSDRREHAAVLREQGW